MKIIIHIGGEDMVMDGKEQVKTQKDKPSLIDAILEPFQKVSDSIFLGLSKDENDFNEKKEFVEKGIKNEW